MITSLSIGTGGLGRFGNTAFTIAGVIGIATKSGQSYGFPHWKTHDNAIFGDPVDDIQSHLVNQLPGIVDVPFQEYGYFWGYRNIYLPDGNWSIDAHLQDPRYFEHCMPLIRETFRFKDEPEQNDFVAIHYRAGDYIDDPTAYHPRCDMLYYKRAMCHFPNDQKYIVFSDDKRAAQDLIYNLTDNAVFWCQDYITDFKMMKRCHSFITANSSFSLMAAILGEHPEKKIICPRNWFGSSAGLVFDGYPENATVI